MRTMACKQCGRPFEASGGKDTYLCPDCSARYFRGASVRERTCRQCGKVFPGGPRAWYCPDCRRERQREADRRHKKNGTARPIGSTDLCKRCGQEYIVNSARQMYCQECSKIAVPEKTRQQSREYNAAHRETLAQNKTESRKGRNVCVVCGALFDAKTVTVTCSPECARLRKRQTQQKAEANRRRNQNDR